MTEITIVGLDLAKRVFQVHGATADGGVAIRKKLSRGQVLAFFADLPPCVVAMEACATAHYWAREIGALGHTVRLVPPAYVKPFVKRQKNDAADAEAIAEAASRPTMRFVEPKSSRQQARAMVFRTRDLFVRQRTQTINALRAHLAEHGLIAAQGLSNLAGIQRVVDEGTADLEPLIAETARVYLEQINDLSSRIAKMEATLKHEAARSDTSSRMMTMPGLGPITAMAIEAFAPPCQCSSAVGISRPGLAWCHDNILLGVSRSWAECRRWDNAISGGCSSSAQCRSSAGQPVKEQSREPGYMPCCSASHARWSQSRWPTRWPEHSGRWKRGKKIIRIHDWQQPDSVR